MLYTNAYFTKANVLGHTSLTNFSNEPPHSFVNETNVYLIPKHRLLEGKFTIFIRVTLCIAENLNF